MRSSGAVIFLLLGLVFSCSKAEEGSLEVGAHSGSLCPSGKGLVAGKSIIGDNDWRPVTGGEETFNNNEFAVAKLTIGTAGACTGFLINDEMIMTNNHCVATNGKKVIARFETEGEVVSAECNQLVMTDAVLDFTILKCNKNFSGMIAPVVIEEEYLKAPTDVYVIQQNCDYLENPYCQIKRMVSYGVLSAQHRIIIDHTADTLPGSSGSPIFDEGTHKLVALHNAGNPTQYDPNGLNHGINIQWIVQKIKNSNKKINLFFSAPRVSLPDTGEDDEEYQDECSS